MPRILGCGQLRHSGATVANGYSISPTRSSPTSAESHVAYSATSTILENATSAIRHPHSPDIYPPALAECRTVLHFPLYVQRIDEVGLECMRV